MSDFTIEQLEALKEGTTPGPWAAIADYPYISIVIANDIDQIHAPIADIADGTTDGPEVDKHHELMAAAPALVDALIAEKRAHQALRDELAHWKKAAEDSAMRASSIGDSERAFNQNGVVDILTYLLEGE